MLLLRLGKEGREGLPVGYVAFNEFGISVGRLDLPFHILLSPDLLYYKMLTYEPNFAASSSPSETLTSPNTTIEPRATRRDTIAAPMPLAPPVRILQHACAYYSIEGH